jgi:hypothetical protein
MWVWLFVTTAVAEPSGLEAVQQALSLRHPISCTELLALSATPVETLLHVVDHTSMPPWSPMRAAECLIEHHATDIEARLVQWVGDEELKGLGRLTVARLDRMPVEVGAHVARAALQGTEPDRARAACEASEHAELKALVAP